jgi:hypothetical protein
MAGLSVIGHDVLERDIDEGLRCCIWFAEGGVSVFGVVARDTTVWFWITLGIEGVGDGRDAVRRG